MKLHIFYIDDMSAGYDRNFDPGVHLAHYSYVTTIDSDSLPDLYGRTDENLYRAMNVVDGTELPTKLRVRSMSVGDAYVTGGSVHVVLPVGWKEFNNPALVQGFMDNAGFHAQYKPNPRRRR